MFKRKARSFTKQKRSVGYGEGNRRDRQSRFTTFHCLGCNAKMPHINQRLIDGAVLRLYDLICKNCRKKGISYEIIQRLASTQSRLFYFCG